MSTARAAHMVLQQEVGLVAGHVSAVPLCLRPALWWSLRPQFTHDFQWTADLSQEDCGNPDGVLYTCL